MILRLCLKDKTSVLVKYISLVALVEEFNRTQFIFIENVATGKMEAYNRDYIWAIRISSQEEDKHM